MSGRPQIIVIVGRDAALWVTATALTQALAPIGVPVTAVELPSQLGIASLYATLPALESLHTKIGIEEAELFRATSGSFSLGWNIGLAGSPPFMLAHGAYGAQIEGGDFFAHWLKARRFGLDVALENFSPTAMAARHGRILVPDESTERFGRTDYAYHLPAIAYAAMLKSRTQRLGVTIHETVQVGVERDGVDGKITGVILDGGALITGDLFIDAGGSDGVLIGEALGTKSDDWRAYFPFDRVLTAIGKCYSPVPTYGELRVTASSWTALNGTQAATHAVHADVDDGNGAEAAVASAAKAAGLALSDVAIRTSAPAVRAQPWSANCIAIGGAACALDPLFDLELHAVQLGIVHLLSLFPASREAAVERAEFNRITRSEFERLRDFQSALYVFAGSSAAIPTTLQEKIDAFQARGAVAPMEDETFSPDQWRAFFTGLGVTPESWAPSIDTTPPERVKESFRRILGFVHDKVVEQPTHESYLADLGASGAA
jgi:tryptophan halogenase